MNEKKKVWAVVLAAIITALGTLADLFRERD